MRIVQGDVRWCCAALGAAVGRVGLQRQRVPGGLRRRRAREEQEEGSGSSRAGAQGLRMG